VCNPTREGDRIRDTCLGRSSLQPIAIGLVSPAYQNQFDVFVLSIAHSL
jgi:hypothetical protein